MNIDYNVYRKIGDAKQQLMEDIGKEIQLPDIEYLNESISGAGIAGERIVIFEGFTSEMEVEIPFNKRNDDYAALLNGGEITIRQAVEQYNKTTGESNMILEKIVIRGRSKGTTLGKNGVAVLGEPTIKWTVDYIKITNQNTVILELDKVNRICIINGEDKFKALRDIL